MRKAYWENGKLLYKDLSEEEIAKHNEMQEEYEREKALLPPTETERLEILENAFLEFVGVVLNG